MSHAAACAQVDTSCVFCTRADQPPILLETAHLYVMPDKFPLLPGHTLIISRAHLACYGAGDAELLRELDAVAAHVRRFLEAAYQQPIFMLENGISGQSVFHAHLHLLPLPETPLPAAIDEHPDVRAIAGWDDVCAHFATYRNYRYLEMAGTRRMLAGHSALLPMLIERLAAATGVQRGPSGWIKTTTAEDVLEVQRRWARYRREVR